MEHVGVVDRRIFACAKGRWSTKCSARPQQRPIGRSRAPRLHSSNSISVRVCGLPLGSTRRTLAALRSDNLIGDEAGGWHTLVADPGAHVHLNGKGEARPGGKWACHPMQRLGLDVIERGKVKPRRARRPHGQKRFPPEGPSLGAEYISSLAWRCFSDWAITAPSFPDCGHVSPSGRPNPIVGNDDATANIVDQARNRNCAAVESDECVLERVCHKPLTTRPSAWRHCNWTGHVSTFKFSRIPFTAWACMTDEATGLRIEAEIDGIIGTFSDSRS